VRPAVSATTGGVGNVPVSMAEDILATVTSLLALIVPLIFAFIFLLLATWLAWLVWKRSARVKRIQSA
jgi:heme/copper-type cytochrome/quinol oxidase subunit 2